MAQVRARGLRRGTRGGSDALRDVSDVRGAWQVVNGLPEDQNPELKAICLYLLEDPTWHSYAAALEDSSDPYIRRAMFALLGRAEETSVAEPVQSTMLHALQV